MNIEQRREILEGIWDGYQARRAPELNGSPSLSPYFMRPLIVNPTLTGVREAWLSLTQAIQDQEAGHPGLSPSVKGLLAILSGVLLIGADMIGAHPHSSHKVQHLRCYNFLVAQYGIALALAILASGPPQPSPKTDIAGTPEGQRMHIGGPVETEEPATNGKTGHLVQGTYPQPPKKPDPFRDSDN